MHKLKSAGLLAGPLLFYFIYFHTSPQDLPDEGRAVLGTAAWMAAWWLLEVAPMAVTALLPLVLFPLSGAADLSATAAGYGHKFIFLFLGGFVLAIAIEKWNLHKRMALNIILAIGTNTRMIILGFMVAVAFLSMWISNTATAVMMLPIGTAIVSQFPGEHAANRNFGKALMLSIAYAASVGGMATLIGTPPNLVLSGILEEVYQVEISFLQWLKIGLPVSLLLLIITWLYLTRVAFRLSGSQFPGGRLEIKRQLRELGKISGQELVVLLVFCATAFCWITRDYLLKPVIPQIDDTIIVVFFAILLFVIPSGKKQDGKNGRMITWEEAVKLPWGILLLYGGGLTLASGFISSGLAIWLGTQLGSVEGISLLLLILLLVAAVNFLTEITSNLATTAMLLPVLAAVAKGYDVHPFMLLVGVTLAASCAFMLPVATPPNAIVFGSGQLRIPDMIRAGFALNIISILVITLLVYFLLPEIWHFIPDAYPEGF